MTFDEAIILLQKGKQVKRQSSAHRLQLDKDSMEVIDESYKSHQFSNDDVWATDWEAI